MAGDYEELKAVLQELLNNRFAPKPEYTRGLLGDGQGNVIVANNPDRNYARFNRGSTEYFEIFNVTVPPVDGWPILIGELPWLPGLTQVVGTDWAAYEQSGWGDSISSTSPHAPTHEWPDGSPGADPVSVYLRSIVPFRGYTLGTGSTTFYANSYEYENANGSGSVWGGLPGVDLQPVMASLATGTAKLMGVYLDPITNALAIVTGTTDIFTDASDPPAPSFPSSSIPVARVRVYGGQSSIGEIDIRDARRPFGLSSAGALRSSGLVTGSVSQAQSFGSNGIEADVIAESTAAAGIAVSNDLYIESDEAGLKDRVVNFGFPAANIADHFDSDAFTGWTWATYTGFGTPANIEMTWRDSIVRIWNSVTQEAFAYKTWPYSYNGRIYAVCEFGTSGQYGLRYDDGTDQNAFELTGQVVSGLVNLYYRSITGGSITGPTAIVSGLPIGLYRLALRRNGTINQLYYCNAAFSQVGFVSGITNSINPTRYGMYINNTGGTPNLAQSLKTDYIGTSVQDY